MAGGVAVCHLDADDEITAAVGRLRGLTEKRAVLVLAPGSRIGTSRINFMLLAREADERGLTVAAVSDDPQVRALARSAGVAAFDSLSLAQASFSPGGAGLVTRPRDTAPSVKPAQVEEREYPAQRRAESARRRADSAPAGLGRRWLAVALAALLLIAVVGGGLWAAWFVLPTATITLRPPVAAETPVSIEVTADPSVAVVDPAVAMIPARRIELPLSVSGDFSATGTQVTLTSASGRVRFASKNTGRTYTVPAGSVVATQGGTQFETAETVTIPRANFDTHEEGTVSVGVAARRAGPGSNVAADTITELPSSFSGNDLVSVTNPQPTSGGSRTEQPQATQPDYDQAVAVLAGQIDDALAAALADPSNTPQGLTVYGTTAVAGEPSAEPAAGAIVGTIGKKFTLTVQALGTVLAVDETQIDGLAADSLRAALPTGHVLVGSMSVSHELIEATPAGVRYRAQASSSGYVAPPEDLAERVLGRSITEAHAILEPYGDVQIEIWPGFVDRLPDQPTRLTLRVVAPTSELP